MSFLVRICPHCGTSNGATAPFCMQCGNLLSDVDPSDPTRVSSSEESAQSLLRTATDCPRCGHAIDPGLPLCPACGFDLETLDHAVTSSVREASQGPDIQPFDVCEGMEFRGCRIVRNLRIASTETDLWQIQHPSGQPLVLKLYRSGIFPKQDVIDAMRSLRTEHVVNVLETGSASGRYYEIQEFIENGSLADYIGGNSLPPDEARVVLSEIASALQHLHEANIRHRDLNPSNVLVRSTDPLDLVLTDFGISSLSTLPIHVDTVARTAAYSAPEAVMGVTTAASDWWSLGMLMLELLTGQNYFKDADEIQINFQLVSQPVAIPDSLDLDWQQLLRGLLTRDYSRRWKADEVLAWLSGRADIATYYESCGPTAAHHNPYLFNGSPCRTPRQLAVELARRWEEGAVHFDKFGMQIADWLRHIAGDEGLASILSEIIDDSNLDPGHRFPAALLALHPPLTPHIDGQQVTRQWLIDHRTEALKLLHGSFPDWVAALTGDDWVATIKQHRQNIEASRTAWPRQLDNELVDELSLREPPDVLRCAIDFRTQFVHAHNPQLDSLLRKPDLTYTEAVLLLATPRIEFLTADEASAKRIQDHARLLAAYLGWRQIAKTIRLFGLWINEPMLNACVGCFAAAASYPLIRVPGESLIAPFVTACGFGLLTGVWLTIFHWVVVRQLGALASISDARFAPGTSATEAASKVEVLAAALRNSGIDPIGVADTEIADRLNALKLPAEQIGARLQQEVPLPPTPPTTLPRLGALAALVLLLSIAATPLLRGVVRNLVPSPKGGSERATNSALRQRPVAQKATYPNARAASTSLPKIPAAVPVPQPAAMIGPDAVIEFIKNQISAENARAIDTICEGYSTAIDYKDAGYIANEKLRADKLQYFKEFPRSSVSIIGTPVCEQILNTQSPTFRVKVDTRTVFSDGRIDYSILDSLETYHVLVSGPPKIISHKVISTEWHRPGTPRQK